MSAPPRGRRLCARLAAVLLVGVLSALAGNAVRAASPIATASDWKAIKRVISAQRAALVAGNGTKALEYATPALRTQFGDAETFMAMVHAGYPALLSARYVEFLEGAVIEGLVVQPLRLIGRDNSVSDALYTMEKQPNGVWRISGCRIGPSTVQVAQARIPPRAIRDTASSNRRA